MYSIVGESNTSMNTEIKLIIIGEEKTGKNMIIEKFLEDAASTTDGSTDERFKYVQVEGLRVKIVIQTPGNHENLHSIAPIFFKQAHGIIYVYDYADKKSFTAIQRIINKVRDHIQDKKSMLIANASCDPKANRVITQKEGRDKAAELKIEGYQETNALTGENVREALGSLAEQIMIQRYKDDGISSIGGVILNKQ